MRQLANADRTHKLHSSTRMILMATQTIFGGPGQFSVVPPPKRKGTRFLFRNNTAIYHVLGQKFKLF